MKTIFTQLLSENIRLSPWKVQNRDVKMWIRSDNERYRLGITDFSVNPVILLDLNVLGEMASKCRVGDMGKLKSKYMTLLSRPSLAYSCNRCQSKHMMFTDSRGAIDVRLWYDSAQRSALDNR
jgi:hypothetical protein